MAVFRLNIINFHCCLSVEPYVRMEQLGYHWTDFHAIWFWVCCENLSRKFKFD